jgi:hypothetical protein
LGPTGGRRTIAGPGIGHPARTKLRLAAIAARVKDRDRTDRRRKASRPAMALTGMRRH